MSRGLYRHDVNQGIYFVNHRCYNADKIVSRKLRVGVNPMEQGPSIGGWLKEVCRREKLSLRQAADKTGLSHATIRDIMNGNSASSETIKKLAATFSENGTHHRLALEDHLLILAGHRTPRPEGKEISQPMAQLMDKLSEFSEPQLRLIAHFADFISETGVR